MSSVTKLISIFDSVLSASGQVNAVQAVGTDFSSRCEKWFGCDYIQFVSDYNDLLDQIRDEIYSLSILKQNKKEEYIKYLYLARGVFAPEMLVSNWNNLFERLKDGRLRIFLDAIEGFFDHDAGLIGSKIDKEQILESINELNKIMNEINLNKENKIICSLYIDNLRNIIKNELSFKDRRILREYEALLGRTVSMYAASDSDESKSLKAWMQNAVEMINGALKLGDSVRKLGNLAKDLGVLG